MFLHLFALDGVPRPPGAVQRVVLNSSINPKCAAWRKCVSLFQWRMPNAEKRMAAIEAADPVVFQICPLKRNLATPGLLSFASSTLDQ